VPDSIRVILPRALQLALPVLAILVCTGINLVLQPLIDNRAPFLPYFAGVVVCALYGGRLSGWFALGLSLPVIVYYWLAPLNSLAVGTPADLLALGAYTATGVLLVVVALQAHAARARTERVAAQLERSEWRLQQAVTMANLSVYEWSPATGELRWDARHKAMFGLPADALVDIHVHDAAIHPDDLAQVQASRARCLDPAGDGVYAAECRVMGYDGVARWVASRGQVFFEQGRAVHYLGVARETTREHEAADDLRHAAERARLLSAVSEATRTAEAPRAIATAAMQELRDYLGADRCVYVEVDADQQTYGIAGAALAANVEPVDGRRPLASFGAGCVEALQAGRAYVLDDTLLRMPLGHERDGYERAGIRALIVMPLHKAGRLVAGTCVHLGQQRQWRADEVGAVQLVTERVWEAIERARIAQDLAASEQRFRVAQETSPIAFVMLQAVRDEGGQLMDFQWLFSNAAARRIAGREDGELEGKRLLDLYPALRGTPFLAALEQVVATGEPVTLEMPYRDDRVDGVFLHVIARNEDGVAEWFMDITERRNAERALAQSAQSLERERERLEIALRAGGMGVYEWRVGEQAVWWSPEIYAVFGVDPATFTPTVESFNALVHPDDRALLWQKTEESMAQGKVFTHEYRVMPPDGRLRWIANRSHVGSDVDGKPARVTGVAVDITERKRAEQLLHDADRRKDEFLATLAHELRNPLAPIRNAAALLELEGGTSGPGRVAREVIKRQVAHMVRLVDDLLDVSRITRNRLTLRPEPVVVATAIEQAIEAVRPVIEVAQQDLVVQLPEQPLRVMADPVRLVQVLTNLLTNASKYSLPRQRIWVSARAEGRVGVIEVADQGIGIAPEELPRLFDMFSQASPALDRAQGGLGIGLWLSQQLVELQGGSISAASEGHQRGSRFTVRLRAAQPAVLPPPAPPPAARLVTGARRVLVVDDNIDAADTLATLLTTLGCEVATAFDGLQALQRADAFIPQIVLLDLGLPKMNGYDVCRALRQRYGNALGIVAMTGWGQDEDRRRSREAGFDLHLVKPVDPDVLVDALNAHAAGAGAGAGGRAAVGDVRAAG
jgi:PAS domain S-box-containing protein